MTDEQQARIEALKAIGPESIGGLKLTDTMRVADLLARFILNGYPPAETK